MSSMRNNSQSGAMNLLLIPFILVILLFFGAAGFGYWAYGQSQHFKNDVDQIVETEVEKAKQQVSTQKDKEFTEKEKYPYDTYKGPAAYGSLTILYPKTWSGYVIDSGNSSYPVDGFFHPKQVPTTTNNTKTFALRVQVVQQSYSNVLQQFQGFVSQKKVSVKPYRSPNVPNIIGSRLDGAIQVNKQGSMIVLPMRDKTLKIWTESTDFRSDFDKIVLPNFSFTP